jgi:hypothetical protein
MTEPKPNLYVAWSKPLDGRANPHIVPIRRATTTKYFVTLNGSTRSRKVVLAACGSIHGQSTHKAAADMTPIVAQPKIRLANVV